MVTHQTLPQVVLFKQNYAVTSQFISRVLFTFTVEYILVRIIKRSLHIAIQRKFETQKRKKNVVKNLWQCK